MKHMRGSERSDLDPYAGGSVPPPVRVFVHPASAPSWSNPTHPRVTLRTIRNRNLPATRVKGAEG
jgi:hypothetical protein